MRCLPSPTVPKDSHNDTPKLVLPEDEWITIGKIVAPQGLNGEVRVYPDSDFPERFLTPGTRWLLPKDHCQPYPVELIHGRFVDGKGIYVIQLSGTHHRNDAEALRGAKLMVPITDRPQLGVDEYHVRDLIGLTVIDHISQEPIGVVKDVMTAGNDLLAVEPFSDYLQHHQQSVLPILIPFVKVIVPIVDLESRRIEITPPKGLVN
ncbi:MAG: ribosome maturation factor RimM [Cyanobacteria bacterium WB6_1B_304]|nr:ribosome maturation factor RimM [Cyanobacteria bacterium WB6_1B_304]